MVALFAATAAATTERPTLILKRGQPGYKECELIHGYLNPQAYLAYKLAHQASNEGLEGIDRLLSRAQRLTDRSMPPRLRRQDAYAGFILAEPTNTHYLEGGLSWMGKVPVDFLVGAAEALRERRRSGRGGKTICGRSCLGNQIHARRLRFNGRNHSLNRLAAQNHF